MHDILKMNKATGTPTAIYLAKFPSLIRITYLNFIFKWNKTRLVLWEFEINLLLFETANKCRIVAPESIKVAVPPILDA